MFLNDSWNLRRSNWVQYLEAAVVNIRRLNRCWQHHADRTGKNLCYISHPIDHLKINYGLRKVSWFGVWISFHGFSCHPSLVSDCHVLSFKEIAPALGFLILLQALPENRFGLAVLFIWQRDVLHTKMIIINALQMANISTLGFSNIRWSSFQVYYTAPTCIISLIAAILRKFSLFFSCFPV